MKRWIVALAVLVLAGAGLWLATGGLGRSIEDRVEAELVARGLPQPMAGCMAERMAERLSIAQLRQLEKLGPEEGEADLPLTVAELLERVRRIEDREVLDVAATSAAICAFAAN